MHICYLKTIGDLKLTNKPWKTKSLFNGFCKRKTIILSTHFLVEQLRRDYKVVHEEYLKGRSEIVAMKEKNKALIDAKEEFKNERESYIPVSVHTASVNECKRFVSKTMHMVIDEPWEV